MAGNETVTNSTDALAPQISQLYQVWGESIPGTVPLVSLSCVSTVLAGYTVVRLLCVKSFRTCPNALYPLLASLMCALCFTGTWWAFVGFDRGAMVSFGVDASTTTTGDPTLPAGIAATVAPLCTAQVWLLHVFFLTAMGVQTVISLQLHRVVTRAVPTPNPKVSPPLAAAGVGGQVRPPTQDPPDLTAAVNSFRGDRGTALARKSALLPSTSWTAKLFASCARLLRPREGVIAAAVLAVLISSLIAGQGVIRPYANVCAAIAPAWALYLLYAVTVLYAALTGFHASSALSFVISVATTVTYSAATPRARCCAVSCGRSGQVSGAAPAQTTGEPGLPHSATIAAPAARRISWLLSRAAALCGYQLFVAGVSGFGMLVSLVTVQGMAARIGRMQQPGASSLPDFNTNLLLTFHQIHAATGGLTLTVLFFFIFPTAMVPSRLKGDEEVWTARLVDLDGKRYRGNAEMVGRASSVAPARPLLKSTFWRHSQYYSAEHSSMPPPLHTIAPLAPSKLVGPAQAATGVRRGSSTEGVSRRFDTGPGAMPWEEPPPGEASSPAAQGLGLALSARHPEGSVPGSARKYVTSARRSDADPGAGTGLLPHLGAGGDSGLLSVSGLRQQSRGRRVSAPTGATVDFTSRASPGGLLRSASSASPRGQREGAGFPGSTHPALAVLLHDSGGGGNTPAVLAQRSLRAHPHAAGSGELARPFTHPLAPDSDALEEMAAAGALSVNRGIGSPSTFHGGFAASPGVLTTAGVVLPNSMASQWTASPHLAAFAPNAAAVSSSGSLAGAVHPMAAVHTLRAAQPSSHHQPVLTGVRVVSDAASPGGTTAGLPLQPLGSGDPAASGASGTTATSGASGASGGSSTTADGRRCQLGVADLIGSSGDTTNSKPSVGSAGGQAELVSDGGRVVRLLTSLLALDAEGAAGSGLAHSSHLNASGGTRSDPLASSHTASTGTSAVAAAAIAAVGSRLALESATGGRRGSVGVGPAAAAILHAHGKPPHPPGRLSQPHLPPAALVLAGRANSGEVDGGTYVAVASREDGDDEATGLDSARMPRKSLPRSPLSLALAGRARAGDGAAYASPPITAFGGAGSGVLPGTLSAARAMADALHAQHNTGNAFFADRSGGGTYAVSSGREGDATSRSGNSAGSGPGGSKAATNSSGRSLRSVPSSHMSLVSVGRGSGTAGAGGAAAASGGGLAASFWRFVHRVGRPPSRDTDVATERGAATDAEAREAAAAGGARPHEGDAPEDGQSSRWTRYNRGRQSPRRSSSTSPDHSQRPRASTSPSSHLGSDASESSEAEEHAPHGGRRDGAAALQPAVADSSQETPRYAVPATFSNDSFSSGERAAPAPPRGAPPGAAGGMAEAGAQASTSQRRRPAAGAVSGSAPTALQAMPPTVVAAAWDPVAASAVVSPTTTTLSGGGSTKAAAKSPGPSLRRISRGTVAQQSTAAPSSAASSAAAAAAHAPLLAQVRASPVASEAVSPMGAAAAINTAFNGRTRAPAAAGGSPGTPLPASAASTTAGAENEYSSSAPRETVDAAECIALSDGHVVAIAAPAASPGGSRRRRSMQQRRLSIQEVNQAYHQQLLSEGLAGVALEAASEVLDRLRRRSRRGSIDASSSSAVPGTGPAFGIAPVHTDRSAAVQLPGTADTSPASAAGDASDAGTDAGVTRPSSRAKSRARSLGRLQTSDSADSGAQAVSAGRTPFGGSEAAAAGGLRTPPHAPSPANGSPAAAAATPNDRGQLRGSSSTSDEAARAGSGFTALVRNWARAMTPSAATAKAGFEAASSAAGGGAAAPTPKRRTSLVGPTTAGQASWGALVSPGAARLAPAATGPKTPKGILKTPKASGPAAAATAGPSPATGSAAGSGAAEAGAYSPSRRASNGGASTRRGSTQHFFAAGSTAPGSPASPVGFSSTTRQALAATARTPPLVVSGASGTSDSNGTNSNASSGTLPRSRRAADQRSLLATTSCAAPGAGLAGLAGPPASADSACLPAAAPRRRSGASSHLIDAIDCEPRLTAAPPIGTEPPMRFIEGAHSGGCSSSDPTRLPGSAEVATPAVLSAPSLAVPSEQSAPTSADSASGFINNAAVRNRRVSFSQGFVESSPVAEGEVVGEGGVRASHVSGGGSTPAAVSSGLQTAQQPPRAALVAVSLHSARPPLIAMQDDLTE